MLKRPLIFSELENQFTAMLESGELLFGSHYENTNHAARAIATQEDTSQLEDPQLLLDELSFFTKIKTEVTHQPMLDRLSIWQKIVALQQDYLPSPQDYCDVKKTFVLGDAKFPSTMLGRPCYDTDEAYWSANDDDNGLIAGAAPAIAAARYKNSFISFFRFLLEVDTIKTVLALGNRAPYKNQTYDDLQVEIDGTTLQITDTKTKKTREIKLFQVVVADNKPLLFKLPSLKLLTVLLENAKDDHKLYVHCVSGVGRTGALRLLKVLFDLAKHDSTLQKVFDDVIDGKNSLKTDEITAVVAQFTTALAKLRKTRYAIQTEEQFMATPAMSLLLYACHKNVDDARLEALYDSLLTPLQQKLLISFTESAFPKVISGNSMRASSASSVNHNNDRQNLMTEDKDKIKLFLNELKQILNSGFQESIKHTAGFHGESELKKVYNTQLVPLLHGLDEELQNPATNDFNQFSGTYLDLSNILNQLDQCLGGTENTGRRTARLSKTVSEAIERCEAFDNEFIQPKKRVIDSRRRSSLPPTDERLQERRSRPSSLGPASAIAMWKPAKPAAEKPLETSHTPLTHNSSLDYS